MIFYLSISYLQYLVVRNQIFSYIKHLSGFIFDFYQPINTIQKMKLFDGVLFQVSTFHQISVKDKFNPLN